MPTGDSCKILHNGPHHFATQTWVSLKSPAWALVAARAQPLKDAGVLEGPPACPRWEHAHIHRLSPLLAAGKQGGVLKPEMHLDAKWDTSVSDQAGVGRGLTSPAAFPTDPANRHSTYRAFQTVQNQCLF